MTSRTPTLAKYLACFGIALLGAPAALAHELRPAVLALREVSPGTFQVRFSPLQTSFGTTLEMQPSFPDHCRYAAQLRELACGSRGLVGDIAFPTLEETNHRVVVRIQWSNGVESARILSGAKARLTVKGWTERASFRDQVSVLGEYTALGIFHILSGIDHLLFVLGLLLLTGLSRSLLWTITAFTAAHSVTLAASLLGLSSLPATAVETTIALSILLVALECTHLRPTLSRRAPWLVALSFGFLHGFGFAGALAEVGLPPHQRGLALLGFNLGVELGQLAVLAMAAAIGRVFAAHPSRALLRHGLVYLMGGLAAFWCFERGAALLGL